MANSVKMVKSWQGPIASTIGDKQLADSEEMFAVCDKKLFGLKKCGTSLTTPFNLQKVSFTSLHLQGTVKKNVSIDSPGSTSGNKNKLVQPGPTWTNLDHETQQTVFQPITDKNDLRVGVGRLVRVQRKGGNGMRRREG